MVCGGSPRSIGFTDSKGRFDLDMNDRRQTLLDSDSSQAGTSSGSGSSSAAAAIRQQAAGASSPAARTYAGCELQAALAGYRSDSLSLANHRALEDPNVGTIVLHRRANVEGLTISATSAFAPKDAKKAFDKALMHEQKSKWPEAERELQTAVDLYPKYAAAWFHLGLSKQQQNNVIGARLSYAKALEADPRYVSPYQQLALLAAREQKWPEVIEQTDRLLKLNPIDFPGAWMYNALAEFQLQRFDVAEKSAREGLSKDPAHQYPKLDQILGVILVQEHQYPEAAQHMRAYLRLAPGAVDAALVKNQLAEVEKRSPPPVTAGTPSRK
jgi:tetratricopeptide (TPR) repeat protein